MLTGHIRSDSSGAGASIGSSSSSVADGSSQASSRSCGRMTGMRLWIGVSSAFGRVVRMAVVTPRSRLLLQMPASASISPSAPGPIA